MPDLVPFNKLAAYLRKSRADGEESVEEVLEKHEHMIQDYCQRVYNAPLPASKIFREVQSGETIANRPVMQQVIRMIQDKEIEGLLCVDLQRLSRGDLIDVGELSRLFLYTKCKILTPTKSYDITDEYDRKFFEMELMHGNDYLEYSKKIMGRGRKQSVLEGNYIGSCAPYGYDKVFVDKKPTLAINPKEAEVVRMIFELYTGEENLGPVLIADRLNKMGIPSQKSDHWTQAAVRNVVENSLYIGKVKWGERKTVKAYKDGKIVESRPRSEDYIEVDGKHEPIIDMETWNKAKEAAATRAHPSARHDREAIVNPLSGLIVCSECGYMMSYKQCYDHKTKAPINPIYLCTTPKCTTRGMPVYQTMSQLRETLMMHLREIELDVSTEPTRNTATEKTRQIYENELADLKRQQEKLYDLLERGIYDEETFIERTAKNKAKTKSLTDALDALGEKEKTAEQTAQFVSTAKKCVDILDDPDAPAAEVNRLLKQIISKIVYQRARSKDRSYTPLTLRVFYK